MWPFSRKPKGITLPPSDDWQVGDIARCIGADDYWYGIPSGAWRPKAGQVFRVHAIRNGPAANAPHVTGQYLVIRPTDLFGWGDHAFVKERPADEGFQALVRKVVRRPVREDA